MVHNLVNSLDIMQLWAVN